MQVTGALGGVEKAAVGARNALTLVAGAAAAGALAYAIDQGTHYQETLVGIQNNAHLTATETASMGVAIQQAAIGTQNSANVMAAALMPVAGELERITGQTLSNADATRVLTAAQDLSEASHVTLAQSVKAVTDTMLVYHQNTGQAAKDATLFFQAQAQLGIQTDTLSRMLQRMQPRLAGSGTSIEQLLGIVRELQPAVGSGARAMMMVGNVLQTLQNPAKGATDMLAALGITVNDTTGKFKGFPVVLDQIKAAYDRLPGSVAKGSTEISKATLLQALFGRQAKIAQTLVEGGSAGIRENTKALAANGTAAQAAARIQMTLGDLLQSIRADFDTAAAAIGGPGVQALSGFFYAVRLTVDALSHWIVLNPGLVTGLLAIVAALGGMAAAGALLHPILGLIGVSLGTILGPLGLMAAGLTAAILIVSRVPSVAGPVIALLVTLREAFNSVVGPIGMFIARIADLVTGIGTLQGVTAAFDLIVRAIGGAVGKVAAALGDVAAAFVAWVAPMIPPLLAALGQMFSDVVTWIVNEIPVVAEALGQMARQFVDWVAPQIGPLLEQLAQVGTTILTWIVGSANAVAAAMVQLATDAIGALASAIIANPGLIVEAIVALFAAGVIVTAITSAGAMLGAAWTAAFQGGAAAVSAIAGFVKSFAETLILQAMEITGTGGVIGAAWDAAFSIAAAAGRGLASLGSMIASVLGLQTAEVVTAAAAQGTAAGVAESAAQAAAITAGAPAVAAAAGTAGAAAGAAGTGELAAGLTAGGGAVSSAAAGLGGVFAAAFAPVAAGLGLAYLAVALQGSAQAYIKPGTGRAGLAAVTGGHGTTTAGIDTSGIVAAHAAQERADAQRAAEHAADLARMTRDARYAYLTDQGEAFGVAGRVPTLPEIKAPPKAKPKPTEDPYTAGFNAAMKILHISLGGGGGATAGATALTAAQTAAAQASTAAQLHLNALKIQLQTAELQANTGNALAAQHVITLKAEIAAQEAADALAAARAAVKVAEAAVAESHKKLVLAQEGKIKGANAVATAEAAYQLSQAKLELATEKLTLAQNNAALQTQTSILTAQEAVAKAQLDLAKANAGMMAAQQKLADAQSGRTKGVDAIAKAEQAYLAAQQRLAAAQDKLTTAQQKLAAAAGAAGGAVGAAGGMATTIGGGAASAAAAAAGHVTVQTIEVQVPPAAIASAPFTSGGLTATPGAPGLLASPSMAGAPIQVHSTIDNRIFLDNQEMKRWISEIVAEEIRSIAGPAVPGSAQ